MNTVTRREMMSMMAGGALSRFRRPPGPAALKFVRLNHIDFFVSDVEKSKRFFGPIFQFPVKQQDGKWYVSLGSGYLQFGMPADRNGDKRLDRVVISAADEETVPTCLKESGVGFVREEDDRTTLVQDSDHITTGFTSRGWENFGAGLLYGLSVAAPVSIDPLFQPIGIQSVLLNVTDPEASIRFYQRFLGTPVRGDNNRTWFQIGEGLLGIQPKPKTDLGAIHYLSIGVERFNTDAAIKSLQKFGAKDVRISTDTSALGPQRSGPPPKILTFSDADGMTDGFRFQIIGGY